MSLGRTRQNFNFLVRTQLGQVRMYGRKALRTCERRNKAGDQRKSKAIEEIIKKSSQVTLLNINFYHFLNVLLNQRRS